MCGKVLLVSEMPTWAGLSLVNSGLLTRIARVDGTRSNSNSETSWRKEVSDVRYNVTRGQRNKGITELYWVTLEQPKSGTIREIWVPDIAINYVYDEPMCGLKRFNALNS